MPSLPLLSQSFCENHIRCVPKLVSNCEEGKIQSAARRPQPEGMLELAASQKGVRLVQLDWGSWAERGDNKVGSPRERTAAQTARSKRCCIFKGSDPGAETAE